MIIIRCVYLNEYRIAVAAFTLHGDGKEGKVGVNTLPLNLNWIQIQIKSNLNEEGKVVKNTFLKLF